MYYIDLSNEALYIMVFKKAILLCIKSRKEVVEGYRGLVTKYDVQKFHTSPSLSDFTADMLLLVECSSLQLNNGEQMCLKVCEKRLKIAEYGILSYGTPH